MDYKGIKQFNVENRLNDEIFSIIQIDFDHKDIWELMHQAVAFFHKIPEDIEKEDLLERFLQHLASSVWFFGANNNENTYGLRNTIENQEGYFKVDGSQGVYLLEHEVIDGSDDSDYSFKEVSGYEPFTPDW